MARKPTPQESLGARIREVRKAKALSQMDLVRDHDWTLSHYQKIERGALDPRFTTLVKVADSLGVTVSELLRGL
jgi:transcriptional regulator with XRE-family HTH domain